MFEVLTACAEKANNGRQNCSMSVRNAGTVLDNRKKGIGTRASVDDRKKFSRGVLAFESNNKL